jgi:hypothetical protein
MVGPVRKSPFRCAETTMGSVGVTWRGSGLPAQQDDLLGYLERLAAVNDELLKDDPPPSSEFDLVARSPQRRERLRMRPNIDRIDRAIGESIEVDSSVFADPGEFVRGAEDLGLPIVGVEGPAADEGAFVLNLNAPRRRTAVRLRKASIYGVNFKVFGVGYPWYPGEDRVSFVFLHCPETLFLDGRIVDIFHRDEIPGLIRFETIRGSDWYACAPDIHLREELYLGWFDHFFAWVKFFFIPNLHWWSYQDLPGYARLRAEFAETQSQAGAAVAKAAIFDNILASFRSQAEWHKPSRQPNTAHAADAAGVRSRILRVLRQSGDGD